MNAPISVIIPVFNGARFIHDALDSICNQTLPPLEIVVADDASTDGTPELVERYAVNSCVQVKLFQMRKNSGGPYGPASLAFKLTRGDFVTILDSDDMFERDAFATYMAMFAADKCGRVGLATSDFRYFDEQGVRTNSFFSSRPQFVEKYLRDESGIGKEIDAQEAMRLQCQDFCLPFKGMIRRSAWQALGGPNLEYVIVCDGDFTWRLARHSHFSFRVTKRPLVRIRMRADSMSSEFEPMAKELIRLYRSMLKDVGDPALKQKVRHRLGKELFHQAYFFYKRGRPRPLIPAAIDLAANRIADWFYSARRLQSMD